MWKLLTDCKSESRDGDQSESVECTCFRQSIVIVACFLSLPTVHLPVQYRLRIRYSIVRIRKAARSALSAALVRALPLKDLQCDHPSKSLVRTVATALDLSHLFPVKNRQR